jgi:hypothetical protein
MGLFGAPDVDWSVATEGGRLDISPGGVVRAAITMRPHGAITARRVMAAVVGTEEYAYDQVDHGRSGNSTSRSWSTNELFRQEIQLLGPGPIGGTQPMTLPLEVQLPPTALPSLESAALRVRWKIHAWIDVGGRDPSTELVLVVPLTTAQLNPADAAVMGPQVQGQADGQPFGFWAQPAPLRGGQPFSGAVDVMAPLDPSGTRIELNLSVATVGEGGIPGATLLGEVGVFSSSRRAVTEVQSLWRGGLAEQPSPGGGWRRYAFSGQLALAPVVTAVYPHGTATATLDVVISRRLRPDGHIIRPVAIVDG